MPDATPDVFLPALNGEELSQGDIVDVLPVGLVPEGLQVPRAYAPDLGKPEAKALIYKYPFPGGKPKHPPAPDLFKRTPESIVFSANLVRCVVISEECVALAKAENQALSLKLEEKKRNVPWHVAEVRAWPSDGEVATMDNGEKRKVSDLIAEGRVKRSMALPAFRRGEEVVMDRAYIDFRYITPLSPKLFENKHRLASMTEHGKALLWMGIYQFFSGREFPIDGVTCNKCGEHLSLEHVLQNGAK